MYSDYFGFKEPPFSIAPDPRFLYLSDQHREALAHLLYGISSNGGFVLLTGEVGTGKTTVCRCLLEQIPADTRIAFVLNPRYSVSELLAAICDELEIEYDPQRCQVKDYVDAINADLLEAHARGLDTVLMIDEAQNLSVDVLEQIRLLTNLETNQKKLLQVVLIGQPELLAMLARPELRQLAQRITARYHLRALTLAELGAYVQHRMSVAGLEARIFPEKSLKKLYKLTGGVPRLVNIICDRALLGTFVQRDTRVELNTLKSAAQEVLGESPALGPRWRSRRLYMAALALLGVVLAAAFAGGWQPLRGIWPVVAGSGGHREAVPAPPVLEAAAAGAVAPAVSAVDTGESPLRDGELSNPANWQWMAGTNLAATQILAYQSLFSAWGITYVPQDNPVVCQFARSKGLDCLVQQGSFNEVVQLNRPVVLKLFNAKGQEFYATLTGIAGEIATLQLAGTEKKVRVDDLKLWLLNSYLLLWQKPQEYSMPIKPGDQGRQVIWLERQLAQSQGRAPRSARLNVYDQSLVRQVRHFQEQHGLIPDGIVGPRTGILLSGVASSGQPRLAQAE